MQLKDYVKLTEGTKNYIRVKVTPRQNKTEMYWILEDWTVKVRLKAIPEKWKANECLIGYISEELWIDKKSIEIISWASDTIKLVRISN